MDDVAKEESETKFFSYNSSWSRYIQVDSIFTYKFMMEVCWTFYFTKMAVQKALYPQALYDGWLH